MFLQLIILEVKEEVVGELQSSWTSCKNSGTDTHSGMVLLSPGRTGTARNRTGTVQQSPGPADQIPHKRPGGKPGGALEPSSGTK